MQKEDSECRIFMIYAVVVLEYPVSRNPGVWVTLTTGSAVLVRMPALLVRAPLTSEGGFLSTENTLQLLNYHQNLIHHFNKLPKGEEGFPWVPFISGKDA